MGQVAGIHYGLAEQSGDQAKEAELINIAIPNLVQANQYLNNAELAEQTVKTAMFVKRYSDARTSVERWIELQPLRAKPYQMAAVIEMSQSNFEKAATYLNQVISLQNNPEQGEQAVLALLDAVKNKNQVLGVTEVMASQNPNSSMPPLAAARALLKPETNGQDKSTDDLSSALSHLNAVLNKQPDWVEAMLLKADVLSVLDSPKGAAAFLETQLAARPGHHAVRSAYADFLAQSHRYEEASEQYVHLLNHSAPESKKYESRHIPLLMRIARMQLQQSKTDEALVYLNHILNVDKKSARYELILPSVYYRMGTAYEMQEKWPKAIAAYEKLQALEKADDWLKDTALVRMAIAYLQQNDFPKAKRYLDQLEQVVSHWQAKDVSNRPEPLEDGEDPVDQLSIEWHHLTTQWYTSQNKNEQAYEAINTGLKRYPDSFDLRYTRSLIAEQLGEVDVAISDLEQLLALDSGNPDIKNALGYTLANKTNQYKRAYQLIKEAHDALPDSYAVKDSLGWVLFKQGKLDEAERYLRQAYQQSKDAEISAHLFEVLWLQNKKSEAKRVLNDALSAHPDDALLNETKLRLMNE